jgi:S1 RNA binding domain protein
LSVDERGKIGLSIKQLQAAPAGNAMSPRKAHANDNRRPSKFNSLSFEDKLSKFLKDSDERLTDLKRNTESKRGGRGAARRAE